MDISYFTHSFFLHSHLLQVFPSVLSSVVMSAYDEIIARAASVDLSGFHNGFPPVRYSPSQFDSVVVLDMIPEEPATWQALLNHFFDHLSCPAPPNTFFHVALLLALELRDPENPSKRVFQSLEKINPDNIALTMPVAITNWGTANKTLIDSLKALDPIHQQVLIPVIAAVMLRMTDKTAKATQFKLTSIAKNIRTLYPNCPVRVPTITLEAWMTSLSKSYLCDQMKFSYWKRAVIIKTDGSSVSNQRGLLMDWLLLQSLQYNGLGLISSINLVAMLYPVDISLLMDATGSGLALNSWKRYNNFMTTAIPSFNGDQKWVYIRNFRNDVMTEFSYSANHFLVGNMLFLAELKSGSPVTTLLQLCHPV